MEDIYSLIGNFKNVPIFKLELVEAPICIPIILLFSRFNIGEPDDPCFVLHKWFIS